MTETAHVWVYESDKERIDELADDEYSWPAKIHQLVNEVLEE